MRNVFAAIVLAGTAALTTAIASADPVYDFVNFDVTYGGPTGYTSTSSINNAGQIGGSFFNLRLARTDSYIRNSDGSINYSLNPGNQGRDAGYGVALNNAGQIAGVEVNAQAPHGYSYVSNPDGTTRTFTDSAGFVIVPTGINDHGQVVGYDLGNVSHPGFLVAPDNALTPLSDPTGPGTFTPLAINNTGQIVGYATDSASGLRSGFVRNADGIYAAIALPSGASQLEATGINNLGQIVGWYELVDSSNPIAFLLNPDGSTFSLADPANVYGTAPTGINDAGQISGTYYDVQSSFNFPPRPGSGNLVAAHGFLATPQVAATPEPSSLALLCTGLASLGFLRRRFAAS